MASEWYVAEDGSIHRHPVTVVNNTRNRSTANARGGNAYRSIHQVSVGRKVWFWIVSIIISLLIAVGITQGFGAELYGSDGGVVATIGPYVVFVGALAGTILFGIFCADKMDYNLWAHILGALSPIGGIIAVAIAIFVICLVIAIGLVALLVAFIIGICSEL